MNILFVDRNTKIGGGATYLRTLAPALEAEGHVCFLLAGRGSAYRLVSPTFTSVASHPPLPALAERAIAGAISRWQIDLVVTQTMRSARHALPACRKAAVPLVMNVHGRHGLDGCEAAVSYASSVIAMNQGTADHVTSRCPPAAGKVRVCPLPVDVRRFAPVSRTGEDGLRICHCCRLSRNQALQTSATIEAAAALVDEFPDLSVTIVGGRGERLRKLRHETEAVNEKHGRMLATAPGQMEDTRGYLAAADVVIGGGYVALEALAMNRRVIGIGSSGLWGPVDEDNFDAAFHANFGGSAAANSVTAATLVPILRKTLRKCVDEGEITWGHERVAKCCAPDVVARQVLEVYGAALA